MQINRCWYNLCGGPNEVGPAFAPRSTTGASAAPATPTDNDGTCIEVEAGEGDWVGLCIEGGTQQSGKAVCSRRPETTTPPMRRRRHDF